MRPNNNKKQPAEDNRSKWIRLIDAVDGRRPIRQFSRHGGLILLERPKGRAIWHKWYGKNEDSDLTDFGDWGFEVLLALHNTEHAKRRAPRLEQAQYIGTDSALKRSSSLSLKMNHGGPTLQDWMHMNLRSKGSNGEQIYQQGLFVSQIEYLKLARLLIKGLQDIHEAGFVHCDLWNGSNICLPPTFIRRGFIFRSKYKIQVNFDNHYSVIKFIDYDYAINKATASFAIPPLGINAKLIYWEGEGSKKRASYIYTHNPNTMSLHLFNALKDCHSAAIKLGIPEKDMYTRGTWSIEKNPQLHEILVNRLQKGVDWREDLYQIGILLDGAWKHEENTTGANIKKPSGIPRPENAQANVKEKVELLLKGLKDLGGESQFDHETGLSTPTPSVLPHEGFIKLIESALKDCGQRAMERPMVYWLHRKDNDDPSAADVAISWFGKLFNHFLPKHVQRIKNWYNYKCGVRFRNGGWLHSINHAKTREYFLKAAWNGHVDAQYSLGLMCYEGEGTIKNFGEAMQWWEKAAEQNHAKALYRLSKMYFHGEGVPKNHHVMFLWCLKAAELGYVDAQNYLGFLFSKGYFGVAKDYEKAVYWWKKAALQDSEISQFNLGMMYSRGQGVLKDDKEAVKWWRKAAGNGMVFARYMLGKSYHRGNGVTQDHAKALKLWRKAAHDGDTDAKYSLGWMYLGGCAVRQDLAEAKKWFQNAAACGHSDAQEVINRINNGVWGDFGIVEWDAS